MKKLIFALPLLLLLTFCSKDRDIVELTATPGLIAMGSEGGIKTITVTSTADWTATVSTGATLSAMSGESGESTVTVTASRHVETHVDRLLIVTFKAGDVTKTITVTQARSTPMASISLGSTSAAAASFQGKSVFFSTVDPGRPMQAVTYKVDFAGTGAAYITFAGDDNTKVYPGDNYTFANIDRKQPAGIKIFNAEGQHISNSELYFTSLPIVTIAAPEGIVDEPKRPCTITVTDPEGRTNGSLIYFESDAGIEYRGSGAQLYPKKPFSINMKDEDNKSLDVELLGLRDDNKWILDAMWLDRAKMRNRVCFDIWNEFNELPYKSSEPKAKSGTEGYLVEVILDGEYSGLYTLSDRLDRKQLKLKKKGGILYKTRDWTDECMLLGITSAYDNNSENWNGLSSDYPDEGDVEGEIQIEYKYMSDLIGFVANSTPEEFSEQFTDYIDMGNMVDYFIYINLIMAYDNIGRNMYWGIYNTKTSPVMIPLVWDMDGTLGQTWDRQYENPNTGFLVYSRHHGKDFRLFKRIIEEDPAGIHALIKARWEQLKGVQLAPSNLNAKLDNYMNIQLESGAGVREYIRWPDSGTMDLQTEVQNIKDWYLKRHAAMDLLLGIW